MPDQSEQQFKSRIREAIALLTEAEEALIGHGFGRLRDDINAFVRENRDV